MIHRFVDLLEVALEPNIVFLAFEQTPDFKDVLYKAGNLTTPVRMNQTSISNTTNLDYLADPERSPDGNDVVYCRVGYDTIAPANKSGIYVVDWDDTATTEVYSETGGDKVSLTPTWKPDGAKILFRAKGATTQMRLIKDMNPDGSGVSTLYTGATLVTQPYYSPDGTKIAFSENGAIKVMNADGTGLTTIVAGPNNTPPIWFNLSNVIAYIDVGGGSPGWRRINADGSGGASLSSTLTAGAPSTIKWSVMEDDSAVVTWDGGNLAYIDTAGGGVTNVSPSRTIASTPPDSRPVCMVGRIFFPQSGSPFTDLWSVAPDGSDFREDFDGNNLGPAGLDVLFHGFKGDTINV